MDTVKYKSKYSGPDKCGICKCGCKWDDHHMGIVARQEYIDETNEYYILGECDKYGFNEDGGWKWNKKLKEWEEHCFQYEDRGVE